MYIILKQTNLLRTQNAVLHKSPINIDFVSFNCSLAQQTVVHECKTSNSMNVRYNVYNIYDILLYPEKKELVPFPLL